MAPVLKTGIPERVSGVRIPHSPPFPLPAWQILLFVVTRIRLNSRIAPLIKDNELRMEKALQSPDLKRFMPAANPDLGLKALVSSAGDI
jgi:hypothetical protein